MLKLLDWFLTFIGLPILKSGPVLYSGPLPYRPVRRYISPAEAQARLMAEMFPELDAQEEADCH